MHVCMHEQSPKAHTGCMGRLSWEDGENRGQGMADVFGLFFFPFPASRRLSAPKSTVSPRSVCVWEAEYEYKHAGELGGREGGVGKVGDRRQRKRDGWPMQEQKIAVLDRGV